MKVKDITRDSKLVGDDTWVVLRFWRGDSISCTASGYWFQHSVMEHIEFEVSSFTWQDDKKVFIDIDKDKSLLGL